MNQPFKGTIKKYSKGYMAFLYVICPLMIIALIAGSIFFNNDIMVFAAGVLIILRYKIRRLIFYFIQNRLDNRLLRAGYRFNYTYDDKATSLYISSEQSLVIIVFDSNPFQYSVIHMDQIENPRINNFVTGKGRFAGTYQAAFEFDVEDTLCRVYTLQSKKWLSPYSVLLEESVAMAQKALDRMNIAKDYYAPPDPKDLPSADVNRFAQPSIQDTTDQ